MKKRFIVEIEVDEKQISKKYPNYQFNYNNPNQLVNALINDFIYEGDINMDKKGLKKFGYSKKIIKEIK